MRRTVAFVLLLVATIFWAGCTRTNNSNNANMTATPANANAAKANTNNANGNKNMGNMNMKNMNMGNANKKANTK